MRDKNVYNKMRALPRMSWSVHNLYNLWVRTFGHLAHSHSSTQTFSTLFKQRWNAKRLVRGYHGDFIGETKFKRWYLPPSLPNVFARRRHSANPSSTANEISKAVDRAKDVSRDAAKRAKEEDGGIAPVGSLFLSEVERRLDVVIFRSCLAPSVYQARHMIIRGSVKLNGETYTNPNTRMSPGDVVSVDPLAIPFLRPDALKNAYTYGTMLKQRQLPEQEEEEEEEEREVADDKETDSGESGAEKEIAEGEEPSSETHGSASAKMAELTTPASIIASNGSVFHLPPYAAPFLFIPAYLEVSFPTCSAAYVRHPTARPGYSEIPTPYEADGEVMRLAWEWYSRIRPRMRRKRDLWMNPDGKYGGWPML